MRQYVVLLIANILLGGERLPQQCSKVCSILDLLGFSKYDDILGGDNRYKTRWIRQLDSTGFLLLGGAIFNFTSSELCFITLIILTTVIKCGISILYFFNMFSSSGYSPHFDRRSNKRFIRKDVTKLLLRPVTLYRMSRIIVCCNWKVKLYNQVCR